MPAKIVSANIVPDVVERGFHTIEAIESYTEWPQCGLAPFDAMSQVDRFVLRSDVAREIKQRAYDVLIREYREFYSDSEGKVTSFADYLHEIEDEYS